MAGIPRKTAKIFGGSLNPAGTMYVWGTLASGAPVSSNDPAQIQSTAWLQGFQAALVGNRSPSFQDLNAAMFTLSYQIAYVLSRGIPEWDASTVYNDEDICRVGSTLYISNADNNENNPPANSAQWANLLQGNQSPALCRAWVEFDGINVDGFGNSVIRNSYNVSTVAKIGTGSYAVNFAAPLPSSNYVMAGSAGTQDGQLSGNGDNNTICGGGRPGTLGVKNQNRCNVYCWDANVGGVGTLEDSGDISVFFFGS